MKYEGVSFNIQAVARHKSAKELCGNKSYAHLWPQLSGEQRVRRLTDVYNIAKSLL